MASRGLSFLSGLHPSAPRTLTPRYPHSHPHSYPHSYSHPPHLHLHPQPHPHQVRLEPLVLELEGSTAPVLIIAQEAPCARTFKACHRRGRAPLPPPPPPPLPPAPSCPALPRPALPAGLLRGVWLCYSPAYPPRNARCITLQVPLAAHLLAQYKTRRDGGAPPHRHLVRPVASPAGRARDHAVIHP